MTLYLVKHNESDYRLHKPDGTEMGTWSSDPWYDADGNPQNPAPELAVAVSDYHGNPDKGKGGPPEFIQDDTRVSVGDWKYRDLTMTDETVPWQ